MWPFSIRDSLIGLGTKAISPVLPDSFRTMVMGFSSVAPGRQSVRSFV